MRTSREVFARPLDNGQRFLSPFRKMVWPMAMLAVPFADITFLPPTESPSKGSLCVPSREHQTVTSYYSDNFQELRLTLYEDSQCELEKYTISILEGNDSQEVAKDFGERTALVLNQNNYHPVIGYYTEGAVKVVICGEPSCLSGNIITTMEEVGYYSSGLTTPQHVSLQLDHQSNPVISYYQDTTQDLKLAVCQDPKCESKTITTIDSEGDVGQNPILTLDAFDNPTIFYQNQEGQWKQAVCHTPTCIKSPTPSTSTINVQVFGEGKITSNPESIDCTPTGEKCTATYQTGKEVILQPVAAAGFYFSHWEGGEDCKDGQVTLLSNQSCKAYFHEFPKLTVSIAGEGIVTGKGIDCGEDCTEHYDFNTEIKLTAIPAPGFLFNGWRQECVDQTPTVTLVMEKAKNCLATFEPWPPFPNVPIEVHTFLTEVGQTAIFATRLPAGAYQVQWDFGDATSADTLTATHVYSAAGNYRVTLTVTDEYARTERKTIEVKVVGTLPAQWDARAKLTQGIAVAPSATQLQAEQLLRERLENPNDDLVQSEQADDRVNTHLELLHLNHLARKTLLKAIYGTTTYLTDETLASVDNLAVTYDETTGALHSVYNLTGYLSPPSSDSPEQTALSYLNTLTSLGLVQTDTNQMQLTDSVTSKVTGASHLYWQQMYQELPLYNAQLQVNVNHEGQIISVNNSFLPASYLSAAIVQPNLNAGEAVKKAMHYLGVEMSEPPRELSAPVGVRQETTLDNTGIALEPILASLMWLPLGDLRLVWHFLIPTLDAKHVYEINLDAMNEIAENDGVLTLFDQVRGDTYRVYPLPVKSPQHTTPLPPAETRATVVSPASLNASPYGWHDTDGLAGADYTITRGNNVYAYKSFAVSTDCGVDLNCTFPLNLASPPSRYLNASVTNLFYWNNIIHDVMYEYGFDSAAGNFQEHTYNKGGKGQDAVRALAQVSDWCNATFATPVDGSPPTMSMYLCNGRDGALDNGVVIHEYGHGISNRLVGGPSNVSCLWNTQQPGEGISDWLALVFTHQVGDTGADQQGIGSYLFGLPPDGTIRPQSYSTDPTINTYTYESIKGLKAPHGVGSVWAQALWEVYWALVDKYGFDPNLYNAQGGGGNQRMLLYFTEGLKNTKCSPTFTDMRDGIIQAAQDNYQGKDVCLIWESFAKFGLGVDAVSGGPNSISPTNGFKLPAACTAQPDACAAPTVTSLASGKWFAKATNVWSTGQVPGPDDRVLIKAGHVISVEKDIVVNKLCVQEGASLRALSKELKIRAYPSSMGTPGEIYNQGKILAKNGRPANGRLIKDGEEGGSVKLETDDFTNAATGEIKAGRGGEDKAPDQFGTPYQDSTEPAKGGAGGKILIMANHRVVNYGKIGPLPMSKTTKRRYSFCQDANYNYSSYLPDATDGGNGGQAKKWNGLFGDFMQKVAGETFGGNGGSTVIQGLHIANFGRIASGYGGNAYAGDCTSSSQAGLGGDASIIPLPGGSVTGLSEIDGGEGNVWIEPSILIGGQNLQIYNSQNVTIFGGDNTTLILRNLREEAISATNTITLAVGQNGVVDLRGNAGKVLKAGVRTQIFAEQVLLDEGVSLAEVVDTPNLETYPPKILYHATWHAPAQVSGLLGETLSLDLTLSNAGPTLDTYTVTVTDSAGWPLTGTLSSPVTVEGLKIAEFQLNVTLPAMPARDFITVTATSQHDPSVVANAEITVVAEEVSWGSEIAGQFLDEEGKPKVDVVVQIGDKMAVTDETGSWEIMGLPEGHYTAVVQNQEGEVLASQAVDYTLPETMLSFNATTSPLATETPPVDFVPLVDTELSSAPSTELTLAPESTAPALTNPPPTPPVVTEELKILSIDTCPLTGVINFLCNNHGQVITDATLGTRAIVSGGELRGLINNQGFVSQVTIQPEAVLTGGILSGYILNYGTVVDTRFVGAILQGGSVAGTLINGSRVGGILIDITFAPHAHLIGGRIQGNLRGDNEAPALLEKVRVLKDSHLSGVSFGNDVTLEEGVIVE